jgi:diphthine methyl ester synthase
MFYLIGLGLGNEKDISVKGLEAVKKCDKVFLENYTSRLADFDLDRMKEFYGKEVVLADRDFVEKKCEGKMLEFAKEGNVALLIVGSPLGATTHQDILQRAEKLDVEVEVIDNAGILGAVGVTGLSLYKFGRVTTIPKENENVTSVYDVITENKKMGLHTLVLLDVNSSDGEFEMMSAREGLDFLIKCGLDGEEKVVVCGGLGGKNEVKYGKAKNVGVESFPQCLVVLGELHFLEEEVVKRFE